MTWYEILALTVSALSLIWAIWKSSLDHNGTVRENTSEIKSLNSTLAQIISDNKEDHKEIWDELSEHGKKLGEHDTAIALINQKVGIDNEHS